MPEGDPKVDGPLQAMPDRPAAVELAVEQPGAILRGVAVGVGPTVLLLHAGGERRQVWAPVMNLLVDAGLRCVAFDHRGHGDSGGAAEGLAQIADDVAAMLVTLPPGCVVVGASLGGLAAIAALGDPALRRRVSGLVLVDVVPDPKPGRVRRFLASTSGLGTRRHLVEDILARAAQLRRLMAALDLPILLVRGGASSPLTDDDADRLLRLVPHATVSCVPAAGHLVARDQPVALGTIIAAAAAQWSMSASDPPMLQLRSPVTGRRRRGRGGW
jgi:pimeloyl-ACP methyl ester carboxylesterase